MELKEAIEYFKEIRDDAGTDQWVKERCNALLALAEAVEKQDKRLASIEKRLAKKEGDK